MKTDVLELYVKPNAKENRIEGFYGNRIKIRIASPPEKGKANRKLIRFLSEVINIPKNKIKIISGISSNYKTVMFTDDKTRDYLEVLLDNR